MTPDFENRQNTPEQQATTRQRSLLFLVAAAVIVFDQATKLLIERFLPLNVSWAPVPELSRFFKITHVSNTGAAFGLFPSGSLLFTIVAVFVAAVIVYYNFQLPAGHRLLRLALGLQLGGALGNLVDRLRLGHVTDFLDFGPWPVFNVADTSIVAGVIVLGFLMLQEQKEAAEESSSQAGEGGSGEDDRPSMTNLPSQRQNEQAT